MEELTVLRMLVVGLALAVILQAGLIRILYRQVKEYEEEYDVPVQDACDGRE